MNEWLNPHCIIVHATMVIEMQSNDTLNKFNLIDIYQVNIYSISLNSSWSIFKLHSAAQTEKEAT